MAAGHALLTEGIDLEENELIRFETNQLLRDTPACAVRRRRLDIHARRARSRHRGFDAERLVVFRRSAEVGLRTGGNRLSAVGSGPEGTQFEPVGRAGEAPWWRSRARVRVSVSEDPEPARPAPWLRSIGKP